MPSPTNLQCSYPVHLDVAGRSVLVVGGGAVAARKAAGLIAAGALVTVVAPIVTAEVDALPATVIRRTYEPTDISGAWLVVSCTDDAAVNAGVARDADAAGIWCNSADDPANCSFILPAVARRGDLALTVSTSGRSPALASWLRRRLESELDERYDALVELLSDARTELRADGGTSEVPGWSDALDDGLLDLIGAGQLAEARRRLRRHLGLPQADATAAEVAA